MLDENINNINPMLLIDGYKADHRRQYPKGTEYIYSNFTPRQSRIKGIDKIVFYGLQYFIEEYLISKWNNNFFKRNKEDVISEYKYYMDNYLGKDAIDCNHIGELHDLGYLPIKIKALPEGTLVPVGVPVLTIMNTLPQFSWLTNYIETLMSNILWKPMTSATIAHQYNKVFTEHANKTGYDRSIIQWQGHDFSFRGMSGMEDSLLSASGHLLSFTGTDTIPAIKFIEMYYDTKADKELIGGSVYATEHSTMCMGGDTNEFNTFKRLITEIYPKGIVSIVSDSWDFWSVITDILPNLKNEILARDGRVVIRPDSGNPVDIICGTVGNIRDFTFKNGITKFEDCYQVMEDYLGYLLEKNTPHGEQGDMETEGLFKYDNKIYKIKFRVDWNRYDKQYYYIDELVFQSCEEYELTPQEKGTYEMLWDIFGGETNENGYKILNTKIGMIYGDSITLERQQEILQKLEDKGFSATNLVLGIGSFTYEYVTRDTFGFAMKATWGQINGEPKDIYKNPKTDSGFKKSAKGLLQVYKTEGSLKLKDMCTLNEELGGELQPVFFNGTLLKKWNFNEIRERLENNK
jgi:nicotinamide phosphoribosyltransferase